MRRIEAACCIVGGGPAGMMAGLLFARAGVETVVVEKHGDFLRDFRGDTVHPSTLNVMAELGILDTLLQRPHQRMGRVEARFGGETLPMADFSALPHPFIAFMPQWDFLDVLAAEARRLPTFRLLMGTEAIRLIEEGSRVAGVEAHDAAGPIAIRAGLTVAADGRRSVLRGAAHLPVRDLGAPIDVLWFRLPKDGAVGGEPLFNAGGGGVLVTIDRGDYWQCALVIAKGGIETVRKAGLPAFRQRVAGIVPALAPALEALQDWDQVKLLTVAVDRLERWHRSGLLCIGDAAHAMSPIGGVGINLAVQDAVTAANLLAAKLLAGPLDEADLAKVAERRLWPVRAVQFAQVVMQKRLLVPLLEGAPPAPPLALRVASRLPLARRMLGRAIGLGLRPEHVRVAPALP